MTTPYFQWVRHNDFPTTFLPTDLDTTNFVDITEVGEVWRKFLDVPKGKVHDCKLYFDQYLQVAHYERVQDL